MDGQWMVIAGSIWIGIGCAMVCPNSWYFGLFITFHNLMRGQGRTSSAYIVDSENLVADQHHIGQNWSKYTIISPFSGQPSLQCFRFCWLPCGHGELPKLKDRFFLFQSRLCSWKNQLQINPNHHPTDLQIWIKSNFSIDVHKKFIPYSETG